MHSDYFRCKKCAEYSTQLKRYLIIIMTLKCKNVSIFFVYAHGLSRVSHETYIQSNGTAQGSGNESFVTARRDPSRITEQISRNRAAPRTTTASSRQPIYSNVKQKKFPYFLLSLSLRYFRHNSS